MRTAYILAIALMLVIIGLVCYPSIHGYVSSISLVGQLPLVATAITLLPYAFLAFIIYAIVKTSSH